MDSITYRNKVLMLIGAFLVVGYCAYSFSIKRTLRVVSTCQSLEQRINNTTSAEASVEGLKAELSKLESLIGKGTLDGNEVQSLMLDKVNAYCKENNTELVEVYSIHEYQENSYAIITNSFKVSGDFAAILQLNEALEKRFNQAKITSVQYEKVKNRRTKRNILYATFYIQNISKI